MRLLSRENIGIGVEILAHANFETNDPNNAKGFKAHAIEVKPTGSECRTTLLSHGAGVGFDSDYWAVSKTTLVGPPRGFVRGAFRRKGIFRQCDASGPFDVAFTVVFLLKHATYFHAPS